MTQKDMFSSRWSLIIATMGMVIGTGNIWRFPRIVAKNGGGAFLIAWFVFLFIWSIPLLISEFAIGKKTRKGTMGAFALFAGKKFAWMGGFIVFCTIAIMFYYSVVTGWCLRFFIASLSGTFASTAPDVFWTQFTTSSWQPVIFHALAITAAAFVIKHGISNGIEKANNILIPLLLVILAVAAIRALTLPGAVNGLEFFFTPNWSSLGNYRVWLEALSQSAWSTGAGWGLVLTYAVYMRQKEDIVINSFLAGLGNNAASLLVGLSIFPAVFALAPQLGQNPESIISVSGPGNTGLAFICMPKLFAEIPAGPFFTSMFFLALSIAALTSLIAMFELAVRNLLDLGIIRSRSTFAIWFVALLLGIPSAMNMSFFENQDWVWGIGLLVSGFLYVMAIRKYDVAKFRINDINTEDNDLALGKWFDWIIKYVIPTEFVVLIVWWFYQAITVYEPSAWMNPFKSFSVATCLLQWAIVIFVFAILNKRISNKLLSQP